MTALLAWIGKLVIALSLTLSGILLFGLTREIVREEIKLNRAKRDEKKAIERLLEDVRNARV